MLFYHLKNEGNTPEAFVLDDIYCNCDRFCGIPLVPYSRISELFPAADYEAYVAIGYSEMNEVRKNITERLLSDGYSLPNYIHPSVINDSAIIGIGNLIFAGSIIDLHTQIGNGNIFYPGVMVSHDVKIGNYNFFASRSVLAGNIIIKNQCFFGLNCSVKNGIKIGDSCLAGASAYVSRNLKDGDVLLPPKSILLEKENGSKEMIKLVMRKGEFLLQVQTAL